ncbi:MAG: penicillin-binding protein [Candidatus Nealsonbacteria bacterium]|nr:MAG: penicillin-binding protein [Candidatus Nealsonbacteria bacterium]
MAKRKYQRKVYKKRLRNTILKIIGGIFLFLFLLGVGFFIYYIKDLPRPEKFTEGLIPQSTKIYDREGEVILYEIAGEEKRTLVPLKEIPEYLKWAVIVAEDKDFYEHRGIDLSAIFRAILYDLKIGKPVQGGSTITQQLIRSYFLTRKKTLQRKTREIILTLELERRYSKDQILEWYLNLIPFGSNLYGVEAASQGFFGKHVKELSLAESATLAALIRRPSVLSPYGPNKDQLFQIKDYILERMNKLGYISQEQLLKAKQEELKFQPDISPIKAPHFAIYVKNYLEKKYGKEYLQRAGLRVYTTLDFDLQKKAESIIQKNLAYFKIYNAYNAALVSINPKTGEVLAMVGSKNWHATSSEGCNPKTQKCKFDPKVNVCLSPRQPGSAFKPFAYAQAFQKGFTPDTVVWDVPTEFNPNCSPDGTQFRDKYGLKCYHPKNYDDRFLGQVSFREALAQSRNVPSVKVLYLAGLWETLDLAKEFGITSLEDGKKYGLSLVLGGGEVTLLETVRAYGVFANDGVKVPLNFIKKIEDAQGNIIEEMKDGQIKVISSQVAREINDILSDNKARAPMFGWNSPLYLKGYQVAAKTGTTQNYNDAWTIGYTPSIVTGVWVGNNDNSPMLKPGVSLAGPIWHDFMIEALKKFKKEEFKKPAEFITGKPVLDGNFPEPHCILHFINKNNPLSEGNSQDDSQYKNWEYGVKKWFQSF